MATVDGLTAEAMNEFVNNSVVSGTIDVNGHLQLETRGGDTVDAGEVVGPQGDTGPPGPPGSSGGAPSGAIMMFGATIPPTGWLVCDGSAVSRTTFSSLFSAIGVAWGPGDGVTTFNLPDFRTRMPRMDNSALTLKGGLVPTAHDHNIDGGTAPAIAHLSAVTGPDNVVHLERISATTWTANFDVSVSNGQLVISGGSSGHANGVKVTGTTADNTISTTPTDLLPPFLNVSFIIKS